MEKPAKLPEISVPRLEVLPIFVVLFAIGISAAEIFTRASVWLFFTLTLFLVILSLPEFLQRFRWQFLMAGAISAGIFYALIRVEPDYQFAELFKLDKVGGRLVGVFRGEYRSGKSGVLSFKMVDPIFEFEEQKVSIPVTVDCRISQAEFLPEPEQRYSCRGKFSITQINRAPVFRGIDLHPEEGSSNPGRLAGKIQQKIRTGLKTSLPRRHAAIVTGFILGDTTGISHEDRQLFKETGISHLLAVSGQHLMVLILLLTAIFHWLRIPPISRSLLTATILAVYAMTTSGSPSVWRAFTMYLCISIVLHMEATPSPIRPVSLAALLLLLHNPQNFYNAAFQLSFTAVIGIIYLSRPIDKLFKKIYFPAFLSRYLSAALAANIASIPMTALLFGTVSVVALVVNPMILWLFGYILPASFLIVILSAILPALAVFVAPALTLAIDGLLMFLQKAASLPGHFFYAGNLSGITITGFFALTLYILSQINQRETCLVSPVIPANKPTPPDTEPSPAVRQPEFATSAATARPNPASPLIRPVPPDYRLNNPFRDEKLIRDLDAMLLSCRRLPIKSYASSERELLPLSLFSIDNQNLYHQLTALDSSSIKHEPARLLQAHIYLLALVGSEIINRVSNHISPAPQPGDIRIEQVVRDRYLSVSVLADTLLNSHLMTRASDEHFILIISRAQAIYGRARNQLARIISNETTIEAIEQHMSLRRDLLAWCREFIEFDLGQKRRFQTELRPEQ